MKKEQVALSIAKQRKKTDRAGACVIPIHRSPITGHDNKSGFKKKSKSTSIDYDMIIKAIYLSQVTGHRSLVTGHWSRITGHGDKSGSEKKRKNQIFVKKIDLLES